eukprot:54336-Prorocentrum_minimum.AAC.1
MRCPHTTGGRIQLSGVVELLNKGSTAAWSPCERTARRGFDVKCPTWGRPPPAAPRWSAAPPEKTPRHRHVTATSPPRHRRVTAASAPMSAGPASGHPTGDRRRRQGFDGYDGLGEEARNAKRETRRRPGDSERSALETADSHPGYVLSRRARLVHAP